MYKHLYEIIQGRAERWPHAVAIGGQQGLAWKTLTGRQLREAVDVLAEELTARGVRAGDRVICWLPNGWRTPVYLFAIWRLGAVAVPFDRETNPEAAAAIVASTEPRLILVGYDERPPWARDLEITEWWEPGSVASGTSGIDAQPASAPAGDWRLATGDSPLAAIFFTSGTTGRPKGCMISHANLLSQIGPLSERIPLDEHSRLASILPLSHLFELTCGLLYPLSAGAAIHYIPSRRGPDILRVLGEQRVTHMIAVPQLLVTMGGALDDQLKKLLPGPVYRALPGLADKLPFAARRRLFFPIHRRLGGHLRVFGAGGAALLPETQRQWERLGVRVAQGYGASECSPVISCAEADGSTPLGSTGRPLRGVEVRLSAEGELLVRGPNVMAGYWRDPERTTEVLHDGWYATGDLATFDSAGNVVIAGRAKDLIVLPSGLKVWPSDVEDVLRAQPGVKDAAVLMVPGAGGGATLHAYLLAADPAARAADVGGLVAAANGRLAQHQRLASAAWWPEADFPRTSTLKLRRNLLPQPAALTATAVDATAAADDPVGQAVAGVAKVASVRDEQTLAALGLDSLGLVDLALALEEKTGQAVGDGDLKLEMTVAEVRAFLAGGGAAAGAAASGGRAASGRAQPLWPYTWGRAFRPLSAPFDLLYRLATTRTAVLGAEHLADLPPRLVLAGTHHSFADVSLVRAGLARTPARGLARRLVVAVWAGGLEGVGPLAHYGKLAFGLYPLDQHAGRDASLRGLARLAALGNAVLIFPQGVHADPADEIAGTPSARFRPGVGHLAGALEATVVPFGLAGTERMMPPDLAHFTGPTVAGIPLAIRRGPLAIAFGHPLTLAPGEDPAAFAARLQTACFALTRQAEAALGE